MVFTNITHSGSDNNTLWTHLHGSKNMFAMFHTAQIHK